MVRTYRFSAAELAALTWYFGVDSAGGADRRTLAQARRSLRQRGLLVSALLEHDEGVASELAPILATTLRPDRVCVLELARPGHAAQTVHVSFTSACIAANRIDASGEHVLAELDNVAEVVDLVASLGGVADATGPAAAAATALSELLPMARLVAVLLVAQAAPGGAEGARSVCWLLVEDGLWLVDSRPEAPEASARPIRGEELRSRIADTLAAPD